MVAQATTKGHDIIAEGIETPGLRDSLRARGVTHGQGYLFSRPLPAAGLQAYLATPNPPPT
jgi:EAL domain-containing protein (putative c-di-GMP-specific phosphodiesterase class I)